MLTSAWSTVHGLRTHARVAGQAGPPVVLVHGVGVSGRYLEPLAEHLAPTRRAYVPDLPGFGRSQKPPRLLDVPGLAGHLAAWLRHAGLGPVPLVGNSLGCQVIVDLAVRHPDLVGRLVLIGPTTDPRAGNAILLLARGVITLPHESPALYPILLTDYARAPLRAAATLQAGADDPFLAKLPRVRQPALVVRGTRDLIAPRRWVKSVAAALPHGRWAEVPAAAHAAHFSEPGRVAELVQEFLDGDLRRGPDAQGVGP